LHRNLSASTFRRRVRAAWLQWRFRPALRTVRSFVLFIGYPRSGHTLIAALLDAHPNMVFANGLDAGRHFQQGFSARAVAALSIQNSLRFTRHGRRSNGFDYTVPGGAHGTWSRLEVVGDKSGDLLSERLVSNSGLLDRILGDLDEQARFIHVLRNPYDCIATIAARGAGNLQAAAAHFFGLCEANLRARAMVPRARWHDIRLEALIAEPDRELSRLCGFLQVDPSADYLAACRRLIFAEPRRSRERVSWSPALIAEIESRVGRYPWFAGYAFDDRGGDRGAEMLRRA